MNIRIRFGLMAVLLAGAGCDGEDLVCAPPGTYVGMATRNVANPGTCPATLTLEDIGWELETVTSDDMVCGVQHHDLSGSGSGGCSHTGTADVRSTATGLTGEANFQVNCPSAGAENCSARYDLVWTAAAP